jgi:hypothetical protein
MARPLTVAAEAAADPQAEARRPPVSATAMRARRSPGVRGCPP